MLLSILCLAGCGKRGKEESSGEQPIAWDSFATELARIRQAEGQQQAISYIERSLEDPAYEPIKGQVFVAMLNERVFGGELDAARDAFLKVAENDDQLARMGFDVLMRACAATGATVVIEWCDRLFEAEISDDLKMYAWRALVQAHADGGTLEEMLKRMDAVFSLPGEAQTRAVLSWVMGAVIEMRNFDLLDRFVADVELHASDRPEIEGFLVMVRADALLLGGEFDEAERYLFEKAEQMDDNALAARLRWLIDRTKSDAPARAEAIASRAVEALETKPRTRAAAAAELLDLAVARNDLDAFAARASKLLDSDLGVSRITSAYQKYFYKAVQSGTDEQKRVCEALGARLESLQSLSEADRRSLVLLRLDGAFYREDFGAALTLIESGVPGYDDLWHNEMLNKVSAHLALQQGRKQEAIDLFRKHMETVEVWQLPVVNPENGQKMVKEAVLGYNEKRIGDIYASMAGKSAEAEAAYMRAVAWYEEALQVLQPNTPEYRNAAAELAAVPAGGANAVAGGEL